MKGLRNPYIILDRRVDFLHNAPWEGETLIKSTLKVRMNAWLLTVLQAGANRVHWSTARYSTPAVGHG
jgi:hypothetical protein